MRSDIIYRVNEVIRHVADPRRRLKHLEEETGIPDRNWKQVWSGKQRPTAHMIESLGRRWPQYAFWIITGITDEENGHTAPPDSWTCNQLKSGAKVEECATRYFNLKILVQDLTYGPNGASIHNYVAKKNPTEDELRAAQLDLPKSDNSNLQGAYDHIFGKDVIVWKKKHDDLDQAIAQIAFDRRIDVLQSELLKIKKDDGSLVSWVVWDDELKTLLMDRNAARELPHL